MKKDAYQNFNTGEIVISKAGRDKGKFFIIVNIESDVYAYITDGDLRKVDKPKKKKLKHLSPTGEAAETVLLKLEDNQKITNSEVRKALSAFNIR